MKTSKKTKYLFISILVSLASITVVNAQETENLIGINFNFDKQEVVIKVVSSGCTGRENFKIEVINDTLTVLRVRKDECKAMEEAIDITYTMKEIDINPNKTYVIANKFISNYYIARIKPVSTK